METATTDAVVSPLALALADGRERCRAALDRYATGDPRLRRAPFASALLLALAAFELAASLHEGDPRRELSLLVAAALGRDAAEVVRRCGPGAGLVGCGEACERVARRCEETLGREAA